MSGGAAHDRSSSESPRAIAPPQHASRERAADWLAIAVGTLTTLCISGYQFGRGNHTVYLLEGLRLTRPELFRNDWFVTSTLQYHAMFSWLTAALMRLNILQPVFLIGYLALAILWHVAWLKWTRALGGSRGGYLFSVLLFYLSAAGISLGVFQFLQDGCFLPSNVANIAMLWGFYFWTIDRRLASGFCLGLAGLFHLNYAVVTCGAWFALCAWDFKILRGEPRRLAIASLLALIPSGFNIALALNVKLKSIGTIPLAQFVQIYVRFRHTHHFDPLAWPAALWIAFLWPMPLAVWFWRSSRGSSRRITQTARIFTLLALLQVIAFFFAGVFYVSESLVQMMLWRFSIFIKLLSCVAAAIAIFDRKVFGPLARRWIVTLLPIALAIGLLTAGLLGDRLHSTAAQIATAAICNHRAAIALFCALGFASAVALHVPLPRTIAAPIAGIALCVLLAIVGWKTWLGVGMTPEQVSADYLDVCRWAKSSTDVDAVFLVPPSDTAFRLEAQRAIVVNFKHVPQLSAEIVAWVDRLQDVLGTRDLAQFPRDYTAMLAALDARYESRPAAALLDVAQRRGARYIVVDHPLDLPPKTDLLSLTHETSDGHYFVYDCRRAARSAPATLPPQPSQ